MELLADGTDGSDVVRMVVGDKDGVDLSDREAVVAEILAEGTNADTQVDE